MDDRQNQLLEELSREAIRVFWEESFGGMAYGSRHLQRVQQIARYLCEKEGGNKFLVLAGAWVHDVSLAHGPDYEPERVANLTKKFLIQFPLLRTDEVGRIVECAEKHELGGNFLNLEAKIVHEADVLDKGGLLGFVRHIWKMTNMLERRILKNEQDLEKLEDHLAARQDCLYTNTAIRLVKHLKGPLEDFLSDRRFALETMTRVSQQSSLGVISDKIAEAMASRNDHRCWGVLKSQLGCSYLNE